MMPPMPSVSAIVWRRPYFLGNLEVGDSARLVAADLEHADRKVGAGQRLAPIQRRLDLGRNAEEFSDLVGDDL
jgi:hypothetical protein